MADQPIQDEAVQTTTGESTAWTVSAPTDLGSVSRRSILYPTGFNQSLSPGDFLPGHDHKRKQSLHDQLPESARSGSSWDRPDLSDEVLSIATNLDRGYTAAFKEHFRKDSTAAAVGHTQDLLSGIGEHFNILDPLNDLIRARCELYGGNEGNGNKWLPINELFDLINESRVEQELKRAFKNDPSRTAFSPSELKGYAREICNHTTYMTQNDKELMFSSQRIFAILTMMNKAQDAPEFLKAKICDRDLPLRLRSREGFRDSELFNPRRKDRRLMVGENWKDSDFDHFIDYQKRMLSPFFELNGREVSFHELDDDTILPFIEDGTQYRPLEGGGGSIWRVKIHPAHHNALGKDGENPYFAKKELHSFNDYGIGFRNEVNAWVKSVGSSGHPHLINLLATWRQGQHNYLLFPWADANLRDYWYSRQPPEGDLSLVQWIAKQCLGIAEALRKIHRIPSDSNESPSNNDIWGIHGDIKPENILWFKDEQEKHGKLVICDFGLTRYHGEETRSNAVPAGMTGTYRAPEIDTKYTISRAYDIWTLGCLYLEFITWYIDGPEGVKVTFAAKRAADDHGSLTHVGFRYDKFFNCVESDGTSSTKMKALVKESVKKWIRYLRSHERCSNYFHGFLDLIEKNLLRIDPDSREKCGKVVTILREMHVKCIEEGESYCLVGQPKPMSRELSPVRTYQTPKPSLDQELSARGRTWMINSGSFEEHPPFTQDITAAEPADHDSRRADPASLRPTQLHEQSETVTEETPLLATLGLHQFFSKSLSRLGNKDSQSNTKSTARRSRVHKSPSGKGTQDGEPNMDVETTPLEHATMDSYNQPDVRRHSVWSSVEAASSALNGDELSWDRISELSKNMGSCFDYWLCCRRRSITPTS